MKISKIACVALMSVALSSGAYATLQTDYEAYAPLTKQVKALKDVKPIIAEFFSPTNKALFKSIPTGDLTKSDVAGVKEFAKTVIKLISAVDGLDLGNTQVDFGGGMKKLTLAVNNKKITITADSTTASNITFDKDAGTVTVDNADSLAALDYTNNDRKAEIDKFQAALETTIKGAIKTAITDNLLDKAHKFINQNLKNPNADTFEDHKIDDKGVTEDLINSGKLKNDLMQAKQIVQKDYDDKIKDEKEVLDLVKKAQTLAKAANPDTEAVKQAIIALNAKLKEKGITIDGKNGDTDKFNEDGSELKATTHDATIAKLGNGTSTAAAPLKEKVTKADEALATLEAFALEDVFSKIQSNEIDKAGTGLKDKQKEAQEAVNGISAADMKKYNEKKALDNKKIAAADALNKQKAASQTALEKTVATPTAPTDSLYNLKAGADKPVAYDGTSADLKTKVIDKLEALGKTLAGKKADLETQVADGQLRATAKATLEAAGFDTNKLKTLAGISDFDSGNFTEDEANKVKDAIEKLEKGITAEKTKAQAEFDNLKAAEEASTAADSAFNDYVFADYATVKGKVDALVTANNNLAKAQKALATKTSNRAKQIVIANKLSTQDAEVGAGLSDLVNGNDIAKDFLVNAEAKDVKDFIVSNTKSVKESLSAVTQSADMDIIKLSSNLSTNTRLAKLSNPFNEDLALAYAVKNLEGEKFADNGNSLSSVVKDYTDRFNYDSNLWGNIIGAKGKIKNGANPELYGFTLGYDKAFDNTIVGGFVTYAKSKLDGDLIENKANNYQVGVYTRTFIDSHEIDAKLSIGTSKNKLERKVESAGVIYDQSGSYKTLFANIGLDYGYVVSLSDTAFVKPILGVEYSFAKNKAFDESGDLPLSYNANKSKTIALKAAAEFRKYVENGNYLYITPGLESEIYKKSGDMIARFVGSTTDINFGANDKKSTYFTLQTGAEMKLTENLSTNINFGAKYKSKEQYYNGTLGLKYKF